MKSPLVLPVFAGLFLVLLFVQSCGHGILAPPPPPATDTPTPGGFTHTPTPTNTVTLTATGTVLTPTPTATSTPSSTASLTATSTPTGTTIFTPTGTWMTSTPSPTPTGTACLSPTVTFTGTVPPYPTYQVSGNVGYTGSSTAGSANVVTLVLYNDNNLISRGYWESTTAIVSPGGTAFGGYSFGVNFTGTYYLIALYDYNGLAGKVENYAGSPFVTPFLVGERYTLYSNGCAYPPSAGLNVTGTTTGLGLSLDDSCKVAGIFGTVAYTGGRGSVGWCRRIHIQAFSDPGYSTPLQSSASIYGNGDTYNLVTSLVPGATDTSPIYVQAYFDANGDGAFDTGDPYVNLGQLIPTGDGLVENISFDDTNVK